MLCFRDNYVYHSTLGEGRMNARDILDEMAKSYATCTSYVDTGRFFAGTQDEAAFSFSTIFRRPRSLCLRKHHDVTNSDSIAWCDESRVFVYDERSGRCQQHEKMLEVFRSEDLDHLVPALLLPNETMAAAILLQNTYEITKIGDDEIRLACFCRPYGEIEVSVHPNSYALQWGKWKELGLIRRVVFDSFEFDVPVRDDVFAFRPAGV
jgi:hypothetical protein